MVRLKETAKLAEKNNEVIIDYKELSEGPNSLSHIEPKKLKYMYSQKRIKDSVKAKALEFIAMNKSRNITPSILQSSE